ncbi:hypothetical protein H2200_004545 [Cladophialophora chaetospira]|uniref:C2H2-type domain-containing protein n=1 Tax=Cladophialophora chaetospira TaxID=386627 RepID=A0AA38XDB0_9EURO|nr:hypothetical protein H2200_004545 [Cladophialophora chaetospira]
MRPDNPRPMALSIPEFPDSTENPFFTPLEWSKELPILLRKEPHDAIGGSPRCRKPEFSTTLSWPVGSEADGEGSGQDEDSSPPPRTSQSITIEAFDRSERRLCRIDFANENSSHLDESVGEEGFWMQAHNEEGETSNPDPGSPSLWGLSQVMKKDRVLRRKPARVFPSTAAQIAADAVSKDMVRCATVRALEDVIFARQPGSESPQALDSSYRGFHSGYTPPDAVFENRRHTPTFATRLPTGDRTPPSSGPRQWNIHRDVTIPYASEGTESSEGSRRMWSDGVLALMNRSSDWWEEQAATAHVVVTEDFSSYPFECEHCTEAFATTVGLDRHLKKKHVRPSPLYACKQGCGAFPGRARLERHERIHHVEAKADDVPGGFSQTKKDIDKERRWAKLTAP